MFNILLVCKPFLMAIGLSTLSLYLGNNDLDEQYADVDVRKNGGIVYKSGENYQLKCDVYRPRLPGKHPAIIVVHGGGWRAGSKFRYHSYAHYMAKRGYVVMAINYRHAPKFEFTDQVSDVKTAVRWLKHRADDYSIDPDRIGIWGYSAGGHLAAMVGTTDEDDRLEGNFAEELQPHNSRVSAVAVGGAPCDIEAYPIDSRVLYYWLKSTRRKNPELYRRASPLTYVSDDDPPFHIFHGGLDEVVEPKLSRSLHDRLLQAGVRSDYNTYDKYGHLSVYWYQVGLPESIDFFDSVLKR